MNFCKLIIILSLAVAGTYGVKLPSYFTQCSLSDPNLDKCIENSGNAGLASLMAGDSKIHMVKLTPLHVDTMFIDVNGAMQINFTDFDIFGIETTKLAYIKWNPANRHAEAKVHLDYTSLIGQYDAKGRILIFPINGRGPCNVTFERPKFKFSFEFELETRKNKEYVKIINPTITYDTDRAYFKLYNLFNGNKQLAAPISTFLDENWRDVNKEIGTKVGDALAIVFGNILQNMFNRIPYSDLFSP